jgi:hypothetical protein
MLGQSGMVSIIRNRARRPSLSSIAASPKNARGRNDKWTCRSAVTLPRIVQPSKLLSSDSPAQLLENNNRIHSRKEIPRSGNTLTRAPRGLHDHGLRRCQVISEVVEMRRNRQSAFIT